MVWKILTLVAAVLIGASGYFSFKNKEKIDVAIVDLANEEKTLAARKKDLQDTNDEIAMLNQSILNLEDEKQKFDTETIDVKNTTVETQSQFSRLTSEVEEKRTKLAKWKKVSETFEEIERLRNAMAETRIQIEQSEIDITEQEGVIEVVTLETNDLQETGNELEALRSDQGNGVIRNGFEGQVSQAYNRWNFVVIQGGDDAGVVENAQLDVFRSGQYLCKLLVTEVKATKTVADIVPGSLRPGLTVKAGDLVRSTPTGGLVAPVGGGGSAPKGSAPNGSAPKGSAPTGSAPNGSAPKGSAPGGDPFGGGSDPFGGGGSDPFGGGGSAPKGSAPAGDPFGGSSDPFGGSEPDPFGN